MSNKQDYVSLSGYKDLESKKDKALYRFLELLPGILSWGTLIGAFLLSWISPVLIAILVIIFDLYWLLRIAYLSAYQVTSFKKMQKSLKTNWPKKLKEIDNWEKVHHLIILPAYKEPKNIIRSSCQSIYETKYPKNKITIILTIEKRAGKEFLQNALEIQKEFSNKFFKFVVTSHPDNIPGEVIGKGSNIAWGLKIAKERVVQELNTKKENVIVSSFDIDTNPYPQYFSCLSYHFLTADQPNKSSYQPIPVYNNNIWKAPSFSRIVATSNTFWQMMQQERPEVLVTYSSHSIPFTVLEEVEYPKNVVPDDSRIFWKAFLKYGGDYKVVSLYYPVSMDAVLSNNLRKTISNQYKQQRRWAWGCVDIPFLIFNFLKDKKIPKLKKIFLTWNIIDGFWSWATVSLLIFFLGWLPLALGGEEFNITLLSYNLPRITGTLMRISMIGMLVSAIVSLLILPPKPRGTSKMKKVSILLQWLLLPFTLVLFGSIPCLDAQTRLMIGKHLEFWVTEKRR